ncbi:MAG: protein tyrosine phosphatase [Deltaproteobacteria bacterium]|nr:protein tyrosine phosphatase [Deltaproteobacteria bacterium]
MSGYIDLHCHFLPGVDDGVATADDAVTCLRAAADAGFEAVVLTRHQMAGVYEVPADEARRGREDLTARMSGDGVGVTLYDGAEHYIDDRFIGRLGDGLETLAAKTALLVEIPMMMIPPFLRDVAFRLRLKGYAPILAHVERYREVMESPRKARALSDMGFLLQVNLGSLTGLYGRRVEKAARWVLDEELAFCAASDAHGPSMLAPTYGKGIKELRRYGENVLSLLLRDNPRRVVLGEAL